MRKYIRQHIKQEKRIIKLMYKKGVLDDLQIDLNDCAWEYLLRGHRQRKRKSNGREYSFNTYLPELHTYSTDYWGECDSRSVIDVYMDAVYWDTATGIDESTGWPIGSEILKRSQLIKKLSSIRTIHNDSKINKYLKVNQEY